MQAPERKYQNAGQSCQPAGPGLVDRLLCQLAPWRCVLCSEPAAGMDLCIDCLNDLPWAGDGCPICAQPLPSAAICGHCLRKTPPMDSSVAAFAYLLPVPELIAGLKYGQQPHYARVLGELLAIRLAEAVSEGALRLPDTLVPVPLHAWRRFTRGFNQAELIAASVGRELSLPVANDVVKRVRNTPSQTRLSKAARRQNLRGAFVAKAVRGQRLALVDDVVTTGATVRELARTLKAAGAVDVQVWSVARA